MRIRLNKRGLVMIFVAICLLTLLALMALVVDVGHGIGVNTQLHAVADAAALAAASQLDGTQAGLDNATAQAVAYAAKNKADGSAVILLSQDIEFGKWDMPTKVFNPILPGGLGYPQDINAVRITSRRDAVGGTAVATTFARVFGMNSMDVRAQAVAVRNEPSQCLDSSDPTKDCNLIPIAVCKNSIPSPTNGHVCDKFSNTVGINITLGGASGTPQSALATAFFDPVNANNIKPYANGTKSSPSIYAKPCANCPIGSMINITNGVDASVLQLLKDRYNSAVAPCLAAGSGPNCEDANGNGTWEWKAYVAVICADCQDISLSNKAVCVTGFARVNIERVVATGTSKGLFGFLRCGETAQRNAGIGGGNFGTYSSIPGLVQ